MEKSGEKRSWNLIGRHNLASFLRIKAYFLELFCIIFLFHLNTIVPYFDSFKFASFSLIMNSGNCSVLRSSPAHKLVLKSSHQKAVPFAYRPSGWWFMWRYPYVVSRSIQHEFYPIGILVLLELCLTHILNFHGLMLEWNSGHYGKDDDMDLFLP